MAVSLINQIFPSWEIQDLLPILWRNRNFPSQPLSQPLPGCTRIKKVLLNKQNCDFADRESQTWALGSWQIPCARKIPRKSRKRGWDGAPGSVPGRGGEVIPSQKNWESASQTRINGSFQQGKCSPYQLNHSTPKILFSIETFLIFRTVLNFFWF